MAEQTAIDYDSLEWKDDASGGTPIEAAALNRMEGGIADACAAVDDLRTKRLPTYVVAQDGDTATQDVYSEDILGPCLILDLATRTTYYETGGEEEGHRKALVSGDEIDDIRDSVSQRHVGRVGDFGDLYVIGGIGVLVVNRALSGVSSPWATILTANLPGGVTPAVITRAPIAVDDVGDACVVAVVSTTGTVTINHRSSSTTDFGSGCNAFGEVVFPLAQLSVSQVESGTVSTDGIYAGGTADVEVSFGQSFSSAPTVVAGLVSVSTAADIGSISVAVVEVTATGCTLRFYNDSSSSRAPSASWVAVGA